VRGVGAVGDDREQLGALVRDVGEGELGELRQLLRRARNAHPEAVALARPAVEHDEHGRAEVRRDAGVVAELARRADVGEVAADDDDRVALRLDGLEPLDDARERGIRISSHVVVGDADASS
jgi:hypothetical protein